MSSLLTISNKALRKLGVTEIASLTQQGKPADRCNSAVVDIVKEVLREHPWGFATVWASLPLRSETPPFGYDYAYQLPQESVRLIDVRATESLYSKQIDFTQVKGKIVYTDATPCYARYTEYVESDLAEAPPDFIEACAWRLANEICVPLSKTDRLASTQSGYSYALDRARLNDLATVRERKPDENRTNTILNAREYPNYEDEEGCL